MILKKHIQVKLKRSFLLLKEKIQRLLITRRIAIRERIQTKNRDNCSTLHAQSFGDGEFYFFPGSLLLFLCPASRLSFLCGAPSVRNPSQQLNLMIF